MSDDKPSIFSRLKRAISSTVDDAVDAVSDPGAELALAIDDLGEQIKQAESDLKQAVVERKMFERKIGELERKESAWQDRAAQALNLGDEKLARAALERKVEIGQERADIEQALTEQSALVDDMREQIKASKRKHKSLNMRRGTLMARARAAKKGHGSAAEVGIAQTSRIDAIEEKILAIEAMNEVAAETRGSAMEDMKLEAELRKLDAARGLDDELAALKAKMRADQKALGEGKD